MLHYRHKRQYREFTVLYKMKVEKPSYEVIHMQIIAIQTERKEIKKTHR